MSLNPNLKYKGQKFTNAPVVEAVTEIRFPINLSVDSYKDKFYNISKEEFPDIRLPEPSSLEHHISQPLNYYSRDKKKNLVASATRFSYITRDYSTFHDFKANFLDYLNRFHKSYSLESINRLGLRYINHVVFQKENESIPLNEFTHFSFNLPSAISSESIKDFQTAFTVNIPGGLLRCVVGTAKKNDTDIFILDNDIGMIGNFKVGDMNNLLDKAHDHIENIFLEFLTEDYLKSIA